MKALITALTLPLAAALLSGCGGKDDDTGGTLGPELSTSHEALDYGSVDFGLSSGQQLTVANVGDEPLTISAASVTSPWTLDTELPDTFEPGDSLGVNIGFLGEERGDLEGSFTLNSNDPTRPELVIPLTATVNSPPAVYVSIEPAKEVYTDTIVEAVLDVGGGDTSNLEVAYSWLVDDSLISEVGNPSLPGEAHFNKHQEVRVVITPRVGDIFLDTDQATVTVLNTPPEDPSIQLLPMEPDPGEDLLCDVEVPSVDVDPEDAETLQYVFEWILDDKPYTGIPSTTSYPGDTISGSELIVGQKWDCTLTVTDGDGESTEPQTDTVRVFGV